MVTPAPLAPRYGYRVGIAVEVLPVAARRALERYWAGSLPVLFTLLLSVVGGIGLVRPAERPAGGAASTGLANSVAPAQPLQPSATARGEMRLLAQRGGQWACGPVLIATLVRSFRLAAPGGRWRASQSPTGWGWSAQGQGYRGRAPPAAG